MIVPMLLWFGAAVTLFLGSAHALGVHEEVRETEVRVRDAGTSCVRCDAAPSEPAVSYVPSGMGESQLTAGEADEVNI